MCVLRSNLINKNPEIIISKRKEYIVHFKSELATLKANKGSSNILPYKLFPSTYTSPYLHDNDKSQLGCDHMPVVDVVFILLWVSWRVPEITIPGNKIKAGQEIILFDQ